MRGTARFLTVIVVALALPALLVGPALAGPEPLTKKEFLKQGNAICADVNDEIDALAEQTFAGYEDQEPPPEAIAAFATGFVPLVRQGIADLGALEPPTKDAKKVQKILNAYTKAADKLEADPGVLANSDPFKKGNKLAGKYGLKECAND